jgi:hypothetical protein
MDVRHQGEEQDTMPVVYVAGGRLGDFLHSMYVVWAIHIHTGRKGRILMAPGYGGDSFSNGIENTFRELYEMMASQHFVHSFELRSQGLSSGEALVATNLNAWRQSPLLYHTDWATLLSHTYNFPRIDTPHGWLSLSQITDHRAQYLSNKVLVHQSYRRHVDPDFPWTQILTSNDCVFVTCNLAEYDDFPHRHLVPCHLAEDLISLARVITSGVCFVGNQSAPLALATSLGQVCHAQLFPVCSKFYEGIAPNVFFGEKTPAILRLNE